MSTEYDTSASETIPPFQFHYIDVESHYSSSDDSFEDDEEMIYLTHRSDFFTFYGLRRVSEYLAVLRDSIRLRINVDIQVIDRYMFKFLMLMKVPSTRIGDKDGCVFHISKDVHYFIREQKIVSYHGEDFFLSLCSVTGSVFDEVLKDKIKDDIGYPFWSSEWF